MTHQKLLCLCHSGILRKKYSHHWGLGETGMGFMLSVLQQSKYQVSALSGFISLGLVNISWRMNQAISLKQLPLCPDCNNMTWFAYEDIKSKTISSQTRLPTWNIDLIWWQLTLRNYLGQTMEKSKVHAHCWHLLFPAYNLSSIIKLFNRFTFQEICYIMSFLSTLPFHLFVSVFGF